MVLGNLSKQQVESTNPSAGTQIWNITLKNFWKLPNRYFHTSRFSKRHIKKVHLKKKNNKKSVLLWFILEKAMATHSSALAWEIPWWRSLVGCSPWGREELDRTEQLHFRFSLSCTGEENGNLLQCSCLENPRHGGAWWTAFYGVAQSQTRLK